MVERSASNQGIRGWTSILPFHQRALCLLVLSARPSLGTVLGVALTSRATNASSHYWISFQNIPAFVRRLYALALITKWAKAFGCQGGGLHKLHVFQKFDKTMDVHACPHQHTPDGGTHKLLLAKVYNRKILWEYASDTPRVVPFSQSNFQAMSKMWASHSSLPL